MTAKSDAGVVHGLIEQAVSRGRPALSEYESKRVFAAYRIPATEERLVKDAAEASAAADALGYPVAVKACSPAFLHKSDKGLVRLALRNAEAVEAAVTEMEVVLSGAPVDGFLVQRMISGKREIIVGGMRDALFGPCVMLGVGGIAVEAIGDVSFRLAPLEDRDVLEMIEELEARAIFGVFRGEPEVDKTALCAIVRAVGQLLLEDPRIAQVDINPLLIEGSQPVAVDALITLSEDAEQTPSAFTRVEPPADAETFRKLFEPSSIALVGVSDSPVKWGFRILFNTLEGGYTGRLYGVNPKHTEIMGVPCFPSITDLPEAVDLVFIIVPPPSVPGALRECAAKGVKAVLVITAGYGELEDADAQAAQAEIARIAEETGMLIIGPNCAGLASPAPYSLYCGMISRFPGAGGLAIASQSGNVGTTVLTWAGLHQVGIARFISTGNQAAARMEDYLTFLAHDPRTQSILSYIEGTRNGRALFEGLRTAAAEKPVVVMKGGRSRVGMRAAQSHTGALASEVRLFEAACRQAGVTVVDETYEAMEVASVLMNQPLPKGRRVVIVSVGGGWGVIGADACADAGLDLIPLPQDMMEELDTFLPSWWSRNNPIDLVAATDLRALTRSIEIAIKHPDVDAVLVLGLGYIASARNQYQESALAKELGLDQLTQIGCDMEVKDARKIASFVETYGKPILVASDTVLLAYGAIPNAVIREVEGLGIYAFSCSAHAARALAHLAARYEYKHGIPRRKS